MILTPARRRMRRRIEHLPTATAKHVCESFGVWVRKPRITGKLVCVVCGRP